MKNKLDDYIRFHIKPDIGKEIINTSGTKKDFINSRLNSSLKEKIRETLKELGKNWEENKDGK